MMMLVRFFHTCENLKIKIIACKQLANITFLKKPERMFGYVFIDLFYDNSKDSNISLQGTFLNFYSKFYY